MKIVVARVWTRLIRPMSTSSATARTTRTSPSGLFVPKYPSLEVAPRNESTVEEYKSATAPGGMVRVPDPYRWMEDEEDARLSSWITHQVGLFDSYLRESGLVEKRDEIVQQLTARWNYERYGCPFKRGDAYYFYHNSGLQNQSVLYGKRSLDDEKFLVLDPNTFSEDGTVAVTGISFTEDGSLFAYSISKSGSDWKTIRVRQSSDLMDRKDQLEWVKFSGTAWLHSNEGFFYCRYPKPKKFTHGEADAKQVPNGDAESEDDKGTETEAAKNQMVYFHLLGTDQSEDILIHRDEEHPDWMFGTEVSECGRYLILTISESCEPANRVYLAEICEGDPVSPSSSTTSRLRSIAFTRLIDNFEAEYSYVTNVGTRFWFKTNKDSPQYKVICMDVADPAHVPVTDIIPHSEDVLLNYASCVNDNQLLVSYLKDVKEGLNLCTLEGELIAVVLEPELATITGLTGRKQDTEFFYSLSSYIQPGVIYRYDLQSLQCVKFMETSVVGLQPAEHFEVRQVFYTSKDGTEIPMCIFHKKGLELNGRNPTVLYGYGGFNISLTPYFSVSRWTFIDSFNGVYAIANLRGGGEYGKPWHHAGIKLDKQNVFDDFHAAAEYLVRSGYTSPEKLSINGGSNGGLLVCACANQRPDLYGCVVGQVGVLDMLRFHRFTIGYAWCSDYGNAEKDPAEFDALYRYSPLHNIPGDRQYPSMLLMTADHDDRVVPLHSFKFAAELQHKLGDKEFQRNPLLIRVEVKAGHGAGKPLSKTIQEVADMLVFVGRSLDVL